MTHEQAVPLPLGESLLDATRQPILSTSFIPNRKGVVTMSCPAHKQQELEAAKATAAGTQPHLNQIPQTASPQPVQVRENRRYRLRPRPLEPEIWGEAIHDSAVGNVTITVSGVPTSIPVSLFRLLYQRVY